MKNFLLILITCITILFTSCNTNYFDDYEKEETTTIMTRVVQDPLHPIINGENVYGNWIQLFYIHPTQYIGKWNIYLQYQSGAEWKYYNPNGGNTPYIVLSGEALNSYIIPKIIFFNSNIFMNRPFIFSILRINANNRFSTV